MEQLYLGPNDISWNIAALNEWAYMFTCVSNIFQFKSAIYSANRAAYVAANAAANTATVQNLFPDWLLYKKISLGTLEIAHALNFGIILILFMDIIPNY